MRDFRKHFAAKTTFFTVALLFLTTVAYGGGRGSCSFEKLGTGVGMFDHLEKAVVDRGLKRWYRTSQPKLQNWMGISEEEVLEVKSSLVRTLGIEDDVIPSKLQITTNSDGTVTLKHGRTSYLFTP